MNTFFGSASRRALTAAMAAENEQGSAASDDAAVTTEVDAVDATPSQEGEMSEQEIPAIDPQVMRDSDALHESMKEHAAKLAEALNENTVLMTDLHEGVTANIRVKRNALEFLWTMLQEKEWTEEHLHDFPVPGSTVETCGNGRPDRYSTYVPGRKGPKEVKHRFYDMLARQTGDGKEAAQVLSDIENKRGAYSQQVGEEREKADKAYWTNRLNSTRDLLERAMAVFHQVQAVNDIDGLFCKLDGLDDEGNGTPNPRSLHPIWIYHDVIRENIKPLSISEFLALKPKKAKAELEKIADHSLRRRASWKTLFDTLVREAESDTSKEGQGGGDNAAGADTPAIRTTEQLVSELAVIEAFFDDPANLDRVVKEAAKGESGQELVLNLGDLYLTLKDWYENKGGQRLYAAIAPKRVESIADPQDKAKAAAKAQAAGVVIKMNGGGKSKRVSAAS